MFRTFALTIILAASPALADQNFESGTGATVDCAKDNVVNINHGKGTYTIKGECKQINLNGAESKITVESVTALNINGAGNTITAGTLGDVVINGSKNKITYKKSAKGAKPSVTQLGTGNSITKAK